MVKTLAGCMILTIILLSTPSYITYQSINSESTDYTDTRFEMLNNKPDPETLKKNREQNMKVADHQAQDSLTKAEAVNLLLEHLSVSELYAIYKKVKNGLTESDRQEIRSLLNERLTKEEIAELKKIGSKELERLTENDFK
ncbi:hypothetical protein [Bacillus solitudinis]|uniref:hypothetical protein n=1 Tax=Bacillus solitudinis TaxID=2014074 RepID=UPI000C23470A|nr:hypothetical protein [Bacillus solitudinis]